MLLVIKLLLVNIKPKHNESLLSLLYRTASANLMDHSKWILDNYKAFSGTLLNECRVNWLNDEEIMNLAKFLDLNANQLKSMTYNHILDKNNLPSKNIKNNPWFQYKYSKYCPICIEEDAYQKIDWMSSHSILCLKHGIFLLDRCQSCNKQVTPRNIVSRKCKCNKYLNDNKYTLVKDKKIIKYQSLIEEVIYKENLNFSNTFITDKKSFMETMLFFTTWSCQLLSKKQLSLPSLNIIYEGNSLNTNRLKNTLSIEQAICLCHRAFNIANNWPQDFFELLKDSSNNSNSKLNSFLKNIVPNLAHTSFKAISDALTQFYIQKFSLTKDKLYIRSDEVYVHTNTISKCIVHSEFFNYHTNNFQGVEVKLIEYEEFKSKNFLLENSLSKEELRNRWGTSPKATFSILIKGILKNAFSYRMGSVNHWVISNESIIEIENNLIKNSTILKDKFITLNNAIQWIGIDRAGEILEGLINNKIRFCYRKNKKVSNILISKKECYNFMKGILHLEGTKNNFINIRDLTFLLGVKKLDIIYWIKTGKFGLLSEKNDNKSEIPFENYLHFSRKYITTFQLSLKNNVSISSLLKKVNKGKLKTISGPSHNDGKRVLFFNEIQVEIIKP